ncbi:transcriptional regulator [Shewanella woodyi]|uniref:transcriptional regulator n=1 Tax=Shewanella woodyi TaxID=60961 RepID=UPI0007F90B31|nr:winged helix-turn-helix domain-containing protein [Shewanella woodyi]
MAKVYYGDGFSICCSTHQIQFNDRQVTVRPKTLALIIELIKQQDNVVNKESLLAKVWDDVVCDEQVLFQTISEIRKIFGPIQVIQTYPRKGYAWVATVNSVPCSETVSLTPSQITPSVDLGSENPLGLLLRWGKSKQALPLYFFTVSLLLIFLFFPSKPTIPNDGTVIVLPVVNNVAGQDHLWVPLGAMDQLIGKLSRGAKVMSTEYVLPLVSQIKRTKAYSADELASVFNTTGANLIIESELSGSVHEYKLSYKLHFQHDVKVGVLFSDNVDEALISLAKTVLVYQGGKVEQFRVKFESELKNEMIHRAIALQKEKQLVAANQLLISVLELEPDNNRVRLLLAQWFVEQKMLSRARELLDVAITQVRDKSQARLGRLYYWRAITLFDIAADKAMLELDKSLTYSLKESDSLYLAYASLAKGKLYQLSGKMEKAETAFLNTLNFHRAIFCPMGISTAKLVLAEFYRENGNMALSDEFLMAAREQIELHQLKIDHPLVNFNN